MSSNTSPNDAKISAAVDQLASLEVTDDQTNEKSSDTSAGGASEDEGLWKPHQPNEECPVCFVPLPLDERACTYRVCCGKTICAGCTMETIRADNVINKKRAKKKLPPVDNGCPFCRSATKEVKSSYEERIHKGDGRAAYTLACSYREGDADIDVTKDEAKSLELLHHAADDLSYSGAASYLGYVYSMVDNGHKDETKGRKYLEDAVTMGDVKARFFLGFIEAQNDNIDLAIRHWKLAAAAGDTVSMKHLWEFFHQGMLEKAEVVKALRVHKETCDAINSVERERRKLFNEAIESRNDTTLIAILTSYYDGDITTKQLNKGLKLHKQQGGITVNQSMEILHQK